MSETNTSNATGKTAFGLVSWEQEVGRTGGRPQSSRDTFLRLQPGHNVIRILTKPHEYLVHMWKPSDSYKGFGERVMSSRFYGEDPLEDLGSKPKRRWLLGVIDRKTNSYKILDIPVSVFKGIQELVRDESDWGDPLNYDVDIKVDKNGGATGYYTVIPKNKKPLSPADLEIKEKVDLEDLKRRCTPNTPQQVKERMEAIQTRLNGESNGSSKAQSQEPEDDEDFPAVE